MDVNAKWEFLITNESGLDLTAYRANTVAMSNPIMEEMNDKRMVVHAPDSK